MIKPSRKLALLAATFLALSTFSIKAAPQSKEEVKDSVVASDTTSDKKTKEEFHGRIIKLPRRKVARGLGSLLIEVSLPRGYHFADRAPSRIKWRSKNSKVITFADSTSTGSQKKAVFPFRLPIEAYKGKTELILEASVFFCANDSGICLFDNISIRLPVKITKDGSHKLSLEIEAEAPESLR